MRAWYDGLADRGSAAPAPRGAANDARPVERVLRRQPLGDARQAGRVARARRRRSRPPCRPRRTRATARRRAARAPARRGRRARASRSRPRPWCRRRARTTVSSRQGAPPSSRVPPQRSTTGRPSTVAANAAPGPPSGTTLGEGRGDRLEARRDVPARGSLRRRGHLGRLDLRRVVEQPAGVSRRPATRGCGRPGPSSTMRPSRITATRWAIERTSGRLWVTNSMLQAEVALQAREQLDDRRLHRHVEGRRDLVADEQRRARRPGPGRSPRAGARRRRAGRGSGARSRRTARRAPASRRPSPAPACRRGRAGPAAGRTDSPTVRRGLSEPYGFWKTYWMRLRTSALRRPGGVRQGRAVEQDLAVALGVQAGDGAGERRLAAARLADHGQALAPLERAGRCRAGSAPGRRRRARRAASARRPRAAGAARRRRRPRRPCRAARTSAARMQRARCPGSTSTSGGSSARHASIASSQRGANMQPSGREPGDGARPGMPTSALRPVMCGIAASSRRVYGCAGGAEQRRRSRPPRRCGRRT